MICIIRTTKRVIVKPKIIKKRMFKDFNPELFLDAVSDMSWLVTLSIVASSTTSSR